MITAAPAVPIFSKDPIFYISQKLSPQDKFMPSHEGDSKSRQTEGETIAGPEPVLLFCFRLLLVLSCSRAHSKFIVLVSVWQELTDKSHLVECWRRFPALLSPSLDWMMTLCCNTGLRRTEKKKSTALSAFFSAENCTNSIITYPHTGSLKYNLP